MFWRMAGFPAASPVESILDKETFTLEDLLDEDEIIQECKALNNRLINYLRNKTQLEQLLRYIVEEAPEDADKKRIFKFPFIACEIFTCEVDVILKALVEDDELMDSFFSFIKPDHTHSTALAGYFSKVFTCLYSRKTAALMNYVQGHQEIVQHLVDLIGITSIMEVMIRLIGADESMSSNYADTTKWLKDTELLDMIADKFSSTDSPEVHANIAKILRAIIRCAPPGFAAKICSPGFVGRLLGHALEGSRPKSVLVNSLSVCISLLDPKRLVSASYNLFRSQLAHGSLVAANAETVDRMLERLGDLLKLLDISTTENILPTTYGDLKPPFGKHRLKIVEFISVLLTIGSEVVEKELVEQGAIKRVLDLFFEYPYNNFLHHHVESIIVSSLESRNTLLIGHILQDCDIISKILEAEKQPLLLTDSGKPTTAAQGRSPPRIGNLGHVVRIANKLVEVGNVNDTIHTHLQQNSEWAEWHANVLLKRNAIENINQWACGRPSALQDRFRESDDEDIPDRDYDMEALANNLNQVFQYGNYNNVDIQEADDSLEKEDEDADFDDETTEVVISPLNLGLGNDQDSTSIFTNSNWFACEESKVADESPSSTSTDHGDDSIAGDKEGPTNQEETKGSQIMENGSIKEGSKELEDTSAHKNGGWVEWRETPDSNQVSPMDPYDALLDAEFEASKRDNGKDEISAGEEKNEVVSVDQTKDETFVGEDLKKDEVVVSMGSTEDEIVAGEDTKKDEVVSMSSSVEDASDPTKSENDNKSTNQPIESKQVDMDDNSKNGDDDAEATQVIADDESKATE